MMLLRRRERCWLRTPTPANEKIFQDVFSVGRRKFLVTILTMKRRIARLTRSWRADQLVFRTTFRAGEILVRLALIHGSMWFKTVQENLYHGRPSHMEAEQYQR